MSVVVVISLLSSIASKKALEEVEDEEEDNFCSKEAVCLYVTIIVSISIIVIKISSPAFVSIMTPVHHTQEYEYS